MKRIIIITLSAILVSVLLFGALPAMAAKPPSVIMKSNGFPSGMHFNLNIHGKNPATFTCDSTPGGNSVFIPLYTGAADDPENPTNLPVIKYKSDRKSSDYELYVTDPCAMTEADNTAEVVLPYKVWPDEEASPINADGYFVYARILGKPDNGKPKNGTPSPSGITLWPNYIDWASNEAQLGLITNKDVWTIDPEDPEQLLRFDPTPTGKGKGKSMAKDISPLFTWTGWVCYGGSADVDGDYDVDLDDMPDNLQYVPDVDQDGDVDLDDWMYCHVDSNGDHVINASDIPGDTSFIPDFDGDSDIDLYDWQAFHPDSDGDGDIDDDDWTPFAGDLTDQDGDTNIDIYDWLLYHQSLGNCFYYAHTWIFNIADLVISGQPIENDGTRLCQIRFYPVATTKFTQEAHIIIIKETDPADDSTTEFEFTTSYYLDAGENPIPFNLYNNWIDHSPGLSAGSYTVTETAVEGWDLTSVLADIDDPSGDSSWNGNTAEINAAEGETITVTFRNTQRG